MLLKSLAVLFSFIFINVNSTFILAQNNRINNFNQLNNYFIKLGLNTANNICQAYTLSDLRKKCDDIVNQSAYFDFNAVFLCEDKFFISTQTIICFDTIKDKSYTNLELLNCGNSTHEYEIYDCLRSSGKIVNKNQLAYEYENKIAFDKAENICNAFTNSSTKNDCHNIINNSYFLDVNGVSFCQTKFSISPRILNCFQTIKNKTYTVTNLSQCSQKSSEINILHCLSSSGYLVKQEI
ncbi:MAG: hypothetical protein GW795_05055 [Cyanobacteria bacterium]|nr:hypothetical protein [Cyanobacteria bacterium CG_2015-16_32_12]NCO79175.1 hypothetical protein [Cyanobacteria bacterium CG_2015-22_32_23]NCQ04917.1 hypothetical protein [Cyanobacteria bacterium CG_2015-09_32_10]NCQ41254.1 hypothetical protein [Cyanobacteria bacterium CG_2015-04_32_10]NCS84106.1 hypothetical protein [Cyanobacteria bacterium CG_2015-02_32_10]